jgi:hypothetical protein
MNRRSFFKTAAIALFAGPALLAEKRPVALAPDYRRRLIQQQPRSCDPITMLHGSTFEADSLEVAPAV